LNKASYAILFVALAVILFLILSPGTSGRSNNLCSGPGCHGSIYYQYLDILEEDSAISSTISLEEVKMVSVVVENSANTGLFTTLNNVYVTLSSQNGHFSVNVSRYDIGIMAIGEKTATWQITGVSDGYDSIVITVHGENAHKSISISDSYSYSITVGQPTATPSPLPTPTPTPPSNTAKPTAPTPTSSSTPTPTPSPDATPTPTSQLAIQLTSPADGEQWTAGTMRSINWNANGGSEPLTITLEYSTVGTEGPWSPIAAGISNNGSFTWKTPNTTSTVYIRAVVTDSADLSQTAATMRNVEVSEANPEFPLILIPAMLIPAIAVVTVLFKRKRTKGNNAGKFSKALGNVHVKSEFTAN
jgi:hypothetical protein